MQDKGSFVHLVTLGISQTASIGLLGFQHVADRFFATPSFACPTNIAVRRVTDVRAGGHGPKKTSVRVRVCSCARASHVGGFVIQVIIDGGVVVEAQQWAVA
jgi:hypothetical protein